MTKHVRVLLLAIISVLFLWHGSALAEGEKTFVSAMIGKYHPKDANYDKPMGYEVAVGHLFTENFALELGYGSYTAQSDDEGNRPGWPSLTQPALGHWKKEKNLTIAPLTLTAKAVTSNDYSMAYIGGGIGAYFVDYEVIVDSEFLGTDRYTDRDTVYGIHLETGIGYNTLENVYLGVTFRYSFTEPLHMQNDVQGINVDAEHRLNGYFVTGEVSFKF